MKKGCGKRGNIYVPMKLKYRYNDIVKYHNEVGIVEDTRIHNGILQYLIKLADGTQAWTGEYHLMRYTSSTMAEIGDKVSFYQDGFKYGMIVDIDYKEGFKYLIEMPNRERYWKLEGELNIYKRNVS